jgi:hypothetical protein
MYAPDLTVVRDGSVKLLSFWSVIFISHLRPRAISIFYGREGSYSLFQ